jgi:hypothetical protein
MVPRDSGGVASATLTFPACIPMAEVGNIWDEMMGLSYCYDWSERRDLNPRPLVPQTSALTGLSHAPNDHTIVSANQYRNSRWLGAGASLNGNAR